MDKKSVGIIAAIIVIILLFAAHYTTNTQQKQRELQGLWFVPQSHAHKFGLSQFIMYFKDGRAGHIILIDSADNVLYNDQFAYETAGLNSKEIGLRIATVEPGIDVFRDKVSAAIIEDDETHKIMILKTKDDSEILGIFEKINPE